jgi:hypothetical protein
VAPVVSQLWGAQPAPTPGSPAAAVTNASGAGNPLDLFRDSRPNVRGLFGVAD